MCSIIIRLFLINLNDYKNATKFLKYLYFSSGSLAQQQKIKKNQVLLVVNRWPTPSLTGGGVVCCCCRGLIPIIMIKAGQPGSSLLTSHRLLLGLKIHDKDKNDKALPTKRLRDWLGFRFRLDFLSWKIKLEGQEYVLHYLHSTTCIPLYLFDHSRYLFIYAKK